MIYGGYMRARYKVETDLKKYQDINGYTFNAQSQGTALKHIARRINVSDYMMHKLFKSRKIRLIYIKKVLQ